MPKKKIQPKKQAICKSVEKKSAIGGNNEEKIHDETQMKSNWAKYESLSDFENENSAAEKDFNYLVKNTSSDYSHFEFSAEKLWKKKENIVPFSELFSLNLDILCKGLACVPFYERIGLDSNELSVDEKSYFDKEAENNLKIYEPIKEKFIKKLQEKESFDCEKNNKIFERSVGISASNMSSIQNEYKKTKVVDAKLNINNKPLSVENNNAERSGKEERSVQKILFNDDENLENWLDSVLDE